MATTAAIIPFPRAEHGPALDGAELLRLACRFDLVRHLDVEVLHDEDGALTSFLCRAPRGTFDQREQFAAAAVKRYLGSIADPRLAEMMYVAALYQAGESAWLTVPSLRRAVRRAHHGRVPQAWQPHLEAPDVLDVVALDAHGPQLCFVLRGLRYWVYGLVEG